MPTPPVHKIALYIHLRWDGSIFIAWTNGESSFVSEERLRGELGATRARAGAVLYSREHPDREPPQWVVNTLRLIASYGLPIALLEGPAPSIAGDDSERAPRTLMAAAHTGNDRWTGELIARGQPVDEPDEDGQTALMYAANAGHPGVVRLLLEAFDLGCS